MQTGWVDFVWVIADCGVLAWGAWEYFWFKKFLKANPAIPPVLSRRALELVLLGVLAGLLLVHNLNFNMALIEKYPFIM